MLRTFDGYDRDKAEEYKKTIEAVGGPPIASVYIGAIVTCGILVFLCDLDTLRRHTKMGRENIKHRYCVKQHC